ncbi:hypothetical protein M0R72_09305 [Candidatus Pacearchaeota archaeon]|jgi:hypothetical protein|nr:hypothetical protein [Candidatus Pacearchaeota archaeon]
MSKKSKSPPYTRTTITVPKELKHRMYAVGDKFNWSNIACLAFERKLEEYEVSIQHKPKPCYPLPGSTAVACGMGIGVIYV